MADLQLTSKALQQRIAALSPERRALLEQRLQQQGLAAAAAEVPLVPQTRPAVVPLAASQKNLWVLQQLNPNSSAYHIAFSWRLIGPLNVPALADSLNAIAQRHDSLRTQFVEPDGQPCQKVLSDITLSLPVADLRALPAAAATAEIQRLSEQCVKQPFDLSRAPLFRCQLLGLDDTTHLLLVVLHHIVADGWSRGVLMRELATGYRARVESTAPALPPLPIQYTDYALWQQEWLQSAACRTQLDYWQQQLAGLPALELPSDRPRPAVPNFTSRTDTHALPSDCVAALKTLSQREGTTLFMTLLAAFKVLLHRYTAQEDIGVGVPVANRNQPEVEPLIGFFVNTLVLRTRLSSRITFRKLLQQIKQVAADGFQHSEVPFAKVVEALQPDRDLSQTPLFQVMFQLQSGYQRQNATTLDLELPELEVQQDWLDPGQTKFDMTWHGIEREEGLLLAVEYRTDLFDADRIQRMLGHFQILLNGILANPDRPVAEIPLLSAAERHQLLVAWNQTQTPLPDRYCQQQFEAQVAQTPAAIAVSDATEKLTYAQLNHRANQLAHTLQARGIGPESLVGIYLPRTVELLVAGLGVLKAGGAYVPIDPSLPAERVRFMLADAQASLVVTASATTPGKMWGDAYPTLDLLAEREKLAQAPDHNPVVSLCPDNLAYVIYTSGSTGQPKGTLLTHRGLSNYLHWCTQAYDVAAGGGAPVQSSIGFDATITSLFAPLLVGQPVTLLPETHEVEALSQALQSGEPFSLVKLTPSHLKALAPLILSSPPHSSLAPATQSFILGGEALRDRDIAPWQQHFPNLRLVNEYGPTEAVVGCCIYDVPLDFTGDTVPIGRPIANVQLYVLDTNLEPVPIGVPGELYIGGAGVARGYLNRPDLTAERFVPNPFSVGTYGSTPDANSGSGHQSVALGAAPSAPTGQILYKTGDRARYRPDGILEYLGRMDDQIKLRGYRIEPGEIESALCQHAQIEQAVVVLRDDMGAAAQLVAYVVKAAGRGQQAESAREHGGGDAGQRENLVSPHPPISSSLLRSFLADQLPAYMLPDRFVTLEALPLTVNGKVDRQALPLPEIETVVDEAERPLTETEQQLTGVWAAVLQRDAVGLHDNFFELGGDSILAMQIIAKARQEGLHLTPRQLFQHQTVAELAAVAAVRLPTVISQEPVTGAVPLTPIQRDLFAQALLEPHHFNQAVMVTLATNVQLPILAQALQALVIHHDGLRSHFSSQDDTWHSIIQAPDAVTVPLDSLDLSHRSPAAQTEALAAAVDDWQASLNLAAGPLLRAAWLRLGERGDRLLLIAHHLIVDGVSWRILLADLETAYRQLAAGSPAVLPPKTHSVQAWAHHLVNLGQSGGFEAERAYWREVCAPATAVPVDFAGDASRNTVASMEEISLGLDAAQTQSLLAVATQTYHAQVNEVLLTALGQTLKSWMQSPTVLVDLEGHGRDRDWQNLPTEQELDVSRTVGWFTAVYPVRLQLSSGTLAEQLQAVKEQLRRVPHQGVGYGMLRHLAAEADPALVSPAVISFNYLGQVRLDAAPEPDGLIQSLATESVGQLRSPLGARRYLLDVIALVRDGQLQMIWRYSRAVHRRATIEAIAQRYQAALQSCLATPAPEAAYTPSDFAAARVNQAQLDQLFSKIRGS
ncbi:MAG: amino acid adenylation domain-containing protein [Cyanobacteria bacterium P01_C01_bin.147]